MDTSNARSSFLSLVKNLAVHQSRNQEEIALLFSHGAMILEPNPEWIEVAATDLTRLIGKDLGELSALEILGLVEMVIMEQERFVPQIPEAIRNHQKLQDLMIEQLSHRELLDFDTLLEAYRWLLEYKGLPFQNMEIVQAYSTYLKTKQMYSLDDLVGVATLIEYGESSISKKQRALLEQHAKDVLERFKPTSDFEVCSREWLKALVNQDSGVFNMMFARQLDCSVQAKPDANEPELSAIEVIRLLRMYQSFQRFRIKEQAEHFVTQETQFHLGHVPTEQSHPTTQELSSLTQESSAKGIEKILLVDQDLLSPARNIVRSKEFDALVNAMIRVAKGKNRIRFSGCGSTGRLSAILEIMWRRAWKSQGPKYDDVIDLVAGIITGGDRALVKSVENFEDYQAFGRRQMADIGIGPQDLCIAISEGGETSSVIGTAWEAVDKGAEVFFIFNNPKELLIDSIDRSWQLIEHPEVVTLDLTTGPMAITGSTRMQATSMELLLLGIAMELAVASITQNILPSVSFALELINSFEEILAQLMAPSNLESLGYLVDLEATTYSQQGLITYLADEYLMDVFSDTSERTPTFNLPPMRSIYEPNEVPSWAFPKHCSLPTRSAWAHMLLHEPRGLEWTDADYRAMKAEQSIIENQPPLATRYLYDYPIGIDHLDDRLEMKDSVLLGMSVGLEDALNIRKALQRYENIDRMRVQLLVGEQIIPDVHGIQTLMIKIPIIHTHTKLFEHLSLKLILNAFSSATMAKMGRVQGNFMIYVNPTNKKLIDRGSRIISSLGNISYAQACYELYKTNLLPSWLLKNVSKVAKTLEKVQASNVN